MKSEPLKLFWWLENNQHLSNTRLFSSFKLSPVRLGQILYIAISLFLSLIILQDSSGNAAQHTIGIQQGASLALEHVTKIITKRDHTAINGLFNLCPCTEIW